MYFAEKHLEIAKEVTVCGFPPPFRAQPEAVTRPHSPLLVVYGTAASDSKPNLQELKLSFVYIHSDADR